MICVGCGIEFIPVAGKTGPTPKYHDAHCRGISAQRRFTAPHRQELNAAAAERRVQARAAKQLLPERLCAADACQQPFQPKREWQRFCCKEHRARHAVKAWRVKNPERRREQNRRWAAKHYPASAQRLYGNMKGRVSLLAKGAIKRAQEAGLPFDADLPEKLIARNATHCECCGVEFDFTIGKGNNNRARSISIDRVRPTDGYTDAATRLICFRCNDVKGDATGEELARVAEYTRKAAQALTQQERYAAEANERPTLEHATEWIAARFLNVE